MIKREKNTRFCIDRVCNGVVVVQMRKLSNKMYQFSRNSLTTTHEHFTNQKKFADLHTLKCVYTVTKCGILHEKHLHKQNRTESRLYRFNNSWYLTEFKVTKNSHWNMEHLCWIDMYSIWVLWVFFSYGLLRAVWQKIIMISFIEWLHLVGLFVFMATAHRCKM